MNRWISLFALMLACTSVYSQSAMYKYNLACDSKDVIDTVENYMKQVQSSIVAGNKKWLAANIKYPIRVNLDGKTSVTIKNENEFAQNFDKIFYKAYVELIKKERASNMLCNSQGVTLGNGQIWITTKPGTNPCNLWIIALNNSLEDVETGSQNLSHLPH